MGLLVWGHLAIAQEEAPADSEETDADIEVVVYGQLLVDLARQKFVEDLLSAGYDQVKVKNDRVIYRHPSVWRG